MHIFLRPLLFVRCWLAIPLFFALQGGSGPLPAAGAALFWCLFFLLLAMGRGETTHLDFGVTFFWAVAAAGLALQPGTASIVLRHHFSGALAAALFLAVFLPLIAGAEPFTTVFARRRTQPDLWQTPQFLAINRIMSICWAGILLAGCALAFVLPGWWGAVAPVALSAGAGIPLTRRFPYWYLRGGAGAATVFTQPLKMQKQSGPVGHGHTRTAAPDEERRQVASRLGPVKNALVIQGSPRGNAGATAKMLERFCDGMRAGGIAVETVVLKDHTIRACAGCFSCWVKTPGVCIHKDDMAEILEKVSAADLVVYAQPLYVFSVPGIVKNFLDRSLPRLLPFLVENANGATRHPRRDGREGGGRMLVFSVCGFPERRHFDPMLAMFRHLADSGNTPIVGEIVRPAAESLRFGEAMGAPYERLQEALFAAGREVAEQGYVTSATEDAVAAPLVPTVAGFRQLANRFWETWLRFEREKKEGRTGLGREDYFRQDPAIYFAGMASQFDPGLAGDLAGAVQFHLTGEPAGNFVLDVGEGQCRFREGEATAPDLTVETTLAVWQAIGRGELSGEEAFRQGLYRASGNIGLLARLRGAFAR